MKGRKKEKREITRWRAGYDVDVRRRKIKKRMIKGKSWKEERWYHFTMILSGEDYRTLQSDISSFLPFPRLVIFTLLYRRLFFISMFRWWEHFKKWGYDYSPSLEQLGFYSIDIEGKSSVESLAADHCVSHTIRLMKMRCVTVMFYSPLRSESS